MATAFDIDEYLRASSGAPNRPQFRITQSSVLPTAPRTFDFSEANRPPASRAARIGRLLGRGARAIAPPAFLAEAGLGVAEQAAQTGAVATPANRTERALRVLSGADVTGIGGLVGRVLTGRPAFGASGDIGFATPARGAAGFGAKGPSSAAAPALPDDYFGLDELARAPLVADADLAESAEVAARPEPRYTGRPGVGGFVGALLGLKRISGDAARRAAQARADAAALAARGTAARGAAALQTSELSARLAAEYLRANPGDFAGASAVLSGRSQGAGDNVFFPGLGPKDPTIVGSRRTGAVIARRPRVEAQMGKDAKGVWQIIGPDGRALRPATPDEIAQRNAGR